MRLRAHGRGVEGDAVVVAANFGSDPAEIEGIDGTVALATVRGREGEVTAGRLTLGPAEGAVILRSRALLVSWA